MTRLLKQPATSSSHAETPPSTPIKQPRQPSTTNAKKSTRSWPPVVLTYVFTGTPFQNKSGHPAVENRRNSGFPEVTKGPQLGHTAQAVNVNP